MASSFLRHVVERITQREMNMTEPYHDGMAEAFLALHIRIEDLEERLDKMSKQR